MRSLTPSVIEIDKTSSASTIKKVQTTVENPFKVSVQKLQSKDEGSYAKTFKKSEESKL